MRWDTFDFYFDSIYTIVALTFQIDLYRNLASEECSIYFLPILLLTSQINKLSRNCFCLLSTFQETYAISTKYFSVTNQMWLYCKHCLNFLFHRYCHQFTNGVNYETSHGLQRTVWMGECQRRLSASLFNSTLEPFHIHPSICNQSQWMFLRIASTINGLNGL